MGGERHVGAALPYLELAGKWLRRASEVGRCDHVEDELRRGGNPLDDRTEGLVTATDPDIDGQCAPRKQAIGGAASDHQRSCTDESRPRQPQPPHLRCDISVEIEAGIEPILPDAPTSCACGRVARRPVCVIISILP
jgi:hypothetical protein